MSKTLLVDGNNLLKIGFHGVKDFFNNKQHVGGIWHFLNTLRKFIEEEKISKVIFILNTTKNASIRPKRDYVYVVRTHSL